MPSISIDTVFNIDLDFEIAAFHKRLLAYLIDFALLIAYLYGMKFLLYNVLDASRKDSIGLDILVISLPMLLYSLICEANMNGQTIGKKLMFIRVISLDGGEPTLGQYILRWITKFFEWPFMFGYIAYSLDSLVAYILFTCILGIAVIISISVTKNAQRLGDLAAGTVVVDAKTSLGVEDTVFQHVSNTAYQVSFPQVMKLSDNDINTIKNVLTQARKTNNYDISTRVEYKVKEVLQIDSRLSSIDFLEKLLEDYNYLATKE
ncbi:MAG: RDD family protein [Ferruginibacter sp.]